MITEGPDKGRGEGGRIILHHIILYIISYYDISNHIIFYRTPYIVEMITEGPDKGRGEGGRN